MVTVVTTVEVLPGRSLEMAHQLNVFQVLLASNKELNEMSQK